MSPPTQENPTFPAFRLSSEFHVEEECQINPFNGEETEVERPFLVYL